MCNGEREREAFQGGLENLHVRKIEKDLNFGEGQGGDIWQGTSEGKGREVGSSEQPCVWTWGRHNRCRVCWYLSGWKRSVYQGV